MRGTCHHPLADGGFPATDRVQRISGPGQARPVRTAAIRLDHHRREDHGLLDSVLGNVLKQPCGAAPRRSVIHPADGAGPDAAERRSRRSGRHARQAWSGRAAASWVGTGDQPAGVGRADRPGFFKDVDAAQGCRITPGFASPSSMGFPVTTAERVLPLSSRIHPVIQTMIFSSV